MILSTLKELVRQRTDELLKSKGKSVALPSFDISTPPSNVSGDLAANLVLMIAKQVGEPPRQLAEQILKGFPSHPMVKKAELAGPGFLNFWITDEAFQKELEIFIRGDQSSAKSSLPRQKLLIEYVSANPTGPLHVGHGRGAALGDSLVRVFRYLGHEVVSEFYVNDAGGQIRNLGLSVEARFRELNGETVAFPEDGYKGRYVIDIAQALKDASRPLNSVSASQMIFEDTDYAGHASRRLLGVIRSTLEKFDVRFDQWFHESSLHKSEKVSRLIQELRQKNLAYDQDGATWFRATEFGDEKDRVLQKANEAPTYFASDIAYHADKFSRGFDRYINIWGADHHGYAQRLKGAMKALGQDPERLQIIFNQLVSIKGGRLSKRAGDMVTLQEVIDEVGKDATRFFFALRSPGAHFEFDLDLAKKQASDNPVFYVQYVHARCCSIFREAEKRGFGTGTLAWQKTGLQTPLMDAERAVLLHLMSFDRTVELCARDYSNHHLTVYLLELAGKFHSFYEQCHVLDEDAAVRSFRLGLVEAIRRGVSQGLQLLGVGAPEKL